MQTLQLLTLIKAMLLLPLVATTAKAQTLEAASIDALQVTPFHPISRAEYEAILGLTNGQQTISEARLTASGIAALKGLIAGLRSGLSGTFLASWVGASPTIATKYSDGYPLCVINAGKEPTVTHGGGKQNYNHQDYYQNDHQDYYQHSAEQNDDHSYNGNSYYEPQQSISPNPLVNCIVVVKKKPENDEQPGDTSGENPKPEPYHPWPQHHHSPYPQPQHSWYGYPSAAYYGYPPSGPPPPPPGPPPPPSYHHHHYRSNPQYTSYPSSSSGGYQRYSAYSSYPQYAAFSIYPRQQTPLRAANNEQPQAESEPVAESPPPPPPPPIISTTPAPAPAPTKPRRPSTTRPVIHSLKPIKHLKRKHPMAEVEHEADNSNSVEATSDDDDTPPEPNQHYAKPHIKIYKTDPPYETADADDQNDSTEAVAYSHYKTQIKRPLPVKKNHHHHPNNHEQHMGHTQSNDRHEHRRDPVENFEQADSVSVEITDRPQHSEKKKGQKPKHPSTELNSYADSDADVADSAEITVHKKYPKRRHPKPATSTIVHHTHKDIENEPDSEETSDNSEQNTEHHPRPTTRPHPPAKNKKRKHTNNPAAIPQHPNEYTLPMRQSSSASKKSKREKPTKYPHIAENYAEMAEYPQGSYQPATYPKQGYQSTYPKISYVQPQSHPAPVYVKKSKGPNGSMTSSTSTVRPAAAAAHDIDIDSNETENSAEFIKVRQSDYNE